MRKRAIEWLFVTIVAILVSSSDGYGVMLRQMPLDEMVAESDIVVIARATSLTKDSHRPWAILSVEYAFKGRPQPTISLLLYTGISEESPFCCKIGSRYILFLRSISGGYMSANGAFGTIPLAANVLPPYSEQSPQ